MSAVMVCTCNPSAGDGDRVNPGFTGKPVKPNCELSANERMCLKGDGWCISE